MTRKLRSLFSVLFCMVLLCNIVFSNAKIKGEVQEEKNVTIYFIDQTKEKWVENDNAVMKAIDNTNGHESYWMTKVDEITWRVNVPESAYNITFNRYSSDKITQWNSWSAGGRDANNAYYADGSEYGHWGSIEENQECFHAGDVIYLDLA